MPCPICLPSRGRASFKKVEVGGLAPCSVTLSHIIGTATKLAISYQLLASSDDVPISGDDVVIGNRLGLLLKGLF